MRPICWLLGCAALLATAQAASASTLSVRTDDGLSLSFNGQGAIDQVAIEGTALPLLGLGGFFVSEVTAAQTPLPQDGATRPGVAVLGSVTATGPGELTLTAHLPSLEADFSAVLQGGAALRVSAHLVSTRSADRAFVIYFRVPVSAAGWRWSGALDSSRTLGAADRGYSEFHWRNAYRTSTSATPIATLTSSTAGLALVIPPTAPSIYRLTYQAPFGFQAEWEVGTAAEPTRFPNAAEVEVLLYRVIPRWGYRSALKRLYLLYPQLWTKRALDGSWYLDQGGLTGLASPQDFAIRFSETMTWANSTTRAQGIYAMRYLEPWNDHISNTPEGLQSWAVDSPANQPTTWLAKGQPRQVTAQAALLSAIVDRDGQYGGYNDPANFTDPEGSYRYVLNPDPELPNFLGFTAQSVDVRRVLNRGQSVEEYEMTRQWGLKPTDPSQGYDGYYLDSTNTSCAGWAGWHLFNFRRSHFATAASPLSFDPRSAKVALTQALSALKSVRHIAVQAHQSGKLVMSNHLADPFSFTTGAYSDFLSPGEGFAWALDEVKAARAAAFNKPMSYLNNGQVTAAQFAHSLLFAVFPGGAGLSQNRAVYKTWSPILLAVARAGWEPLTFASSDDPGVLIERYGRLDHGTLHLVVHRENGSTVGSRILLEKAPLGIGAGVQVFALDLVSGRTLSLEDRGERLELPLQLADEESLALKLEVRAGTVGPTEGESLPPPLPSPEAVLAIEDETGPGLGADAGQPLPTRPDERRPFANLGRLGGARASGATGSCHGCSSVGLGTLGTLLMLGLLFARRRPGG